MAHSWEVFTDENKISPNKYPEVYIIDYENSIIAIDYLKRIFELFSMKTFSIEDVERQAKSIFILSHELREVVHK